MPPTPRRHPAVQFLRDWVLGAALPIWIVATFLVMVARVDGNSMNPTYRNGDLLLLYKLPRWLNAWGLDDAWPNHGDIIVFKGPPGHPESYATGLLGIEYRPYLLKRVAGLPGDRVEIRDGFLYRNGQRVTEPHTTGEAAQDAPPVTVPPGSVFVLGDNRFLGDSIDSRYFGPVLMRDIAGTVGPRLFTAASD